MTHRYTIVLTQEQDGSAFNVRVPAMPGICTWGATIAEAVTAAYEAIALHLESYVERGQTYPEDQHLSPSV